MCGHILLAIPTDSTFFIGLIFVVMGTGLLKPNIGALVGQLYSREDNRRDAGYALYYMGINLGSIIGYIVCGWLQVNMGYHWAFGAAAIGMGAGLVQFKLTSYKLQGEGAEPTQPLSEKGLRNSRFAILGFGVGLGLLTLLMLNSAIVINPVTLAQYVALTITIVFLAYYACMYTFANLSNDEKKSLGALFLVCIASTFFWAGFEQAGSSLNLFGRDYTDRIIGSAQVAASGLQAAPYWLIATYFLHTVGELCLSPVALSAVSKLSPRRYAGQMMGVFTLTYSIGNVIAGLVAGNFDPENIQQMPNLYLYIAFFTIAAGILIGLFAFKTRNWETLIK